MKRVSLDEYLNAKGAGGLSRKHFARDDGVVIKAAPAGMIKAASFNKDQGTCVFTVSAEIEDRDRDIVIQSGLNTSGFEQNPVALWAHSSKDPIGSWSNITKNLSGRPKRTEGTLKLTMEDPTAAKVAAHLNAGSLRACSIGFMPTELEMRDVPDDGKGDYFYPGYLINAADLYEISVCSIPSNPAALAKAAADGDVLARDLIEQVLDTWTIEKGLIMPRKAFEDAHRVATGDRRSKLIAAITQKVADALPPDAEAGEEGEIEATTGVAVEFPITVNVTVNQGGTTGDAEASDGSDADDAAGDAPSGAQARSLLDRLGVMLGLKAKTSDADPEPQQDGPKPAPEPVAVPKTPEDELREQFAKDLPALVAKHEIFEADARLAVLDSEMQQHAAP